MKTKNDKRTVRRFLQNTVPRFDRRMRALMKDMTFEELTELLGVLYNLRHEVSVEFGRKMPESEKKKKAH